MDKQELDKLRSIHKKLLVEYLEFHKIDHWSLAYNQEISNYFSEVLNYLEKEIDLQKKLY